jgi:simple sugar transport system permease protein
LSAAQRQEALLEFIYRSRFLNTLIILIVLVVSFAIASPGQTFLRPANLELLLAYSPEVMIVVIGVGLLMVLGEFDLSVGAVLSFCSFVFFTAVTQGSGPYTATLLAVAAGGATGLLNGLLTTRGQIISFIATLGTMLFWRGLTVMLALGQTVSIDLSGSPLFQAALTGSIGGVLPVQTLWFVLPALVLGLLLHRTQLGNWIYATGNNAVAARAMAVPTDSVRLICFTIVGVLVGFAASMQMTRTEVFAPQVGAELGLKALAAAVIGGVSIRGGRGSMVGIVLGGLIVVVVENGLTLSRVAFEWTYIVFGLIVMFSVSMDVILERVLRRAT